MSMRRVPKCRRYAMVSHRWLWLRWETIERNGEEAEARVELLNAALPLITVR